MANAYNLNPSLAGDAGLLENVEASLNTDISNNTEAMIGAQNGFVTETEK